MKVHAGLTWTPEQRTVATLGNFDGVHLGHQAILRHVVEEAAKESLPSVVVTFDPVPRKVLQPDTAPPLIQTIEQRLKAFEECDVDHTIVVAFTLEFARQTPDEFVRRYLVESLRVRKFIVGLNFTFGYRKQGNLDFLKKAARDLDFEVEGLSDVSRDDARISSTRIRESVLAGKVDDAAQFLGRPFSLTGTIVPGEQLGGRIGVPTANLSVENELLPPRGVYVTRALVKEKVFQAVTNVGIRPTVGGTKLTVESHLLQDPGDLYGARMELQFLQMLRGEQKFPDLDSLKAQILKDIESAHRYFS